MQDLGFNSMPENLIVRLSFSLSIISFCDSLVACKRFDLARQLFRSGTSIGANVVEAQNAESTADFIHKFKIAGKEANETAYWLLLCQHSPGYPYDPELMTALNSIIKIINKIISSTKKRHL
jgi:four helix bundle protein